MQESIFNLQNVKCAGCVTKIQTKVNSIAGVVNAQVNLLDKTLVVKYLTQKDDEKVIHAVESIGFGASLDKIEEESINLVTAVVVPILFAIILMFITMQQTIPMDLHSEHGFILAVLYGLISLFILILSGRKIIYSGFQGFKSLAFNMHSLVLLGVASAWIYSSLVILINYFTHSILKPHLYFDSSLMIIGLINLGAFIEDRAKTNTTKAIKSLAGLVPDETIMVNSDGTEQVIATNLLRTDYLVKIKPGAKIPTDGEIISGDGYIDEAMLTGEPLPVHKGIGAEVIGGAINTSGAFIFKVTAVGDNTLLSNIIALVKNAQLAKPKLAKLADDIARIFVPSVICIAAISALIWYYLVEQGSIYYALSIFMTVLLIACPCSVGLAIPVSLMVGIGRGAGKGILIRDASCLSAADTITTIVLDKTGTITQGKPQVINVELVNNIDITTVKLIISALESNSEHPLAKAILAYCAITSETSGVSDFESISGCGVRGRVNAKLFYAGSKQWMEMLKLLNNELLIESTYSQIYLASETHILARFEIADKIKDDAKQAIAELKHKQLNIIMLTGDNLTSANKIANEVGISEVVANCKPEEKTKKVFELQQSGYKVVFVGDGINDAPSLAQADIGIAIGGGTDIAKQSAAITLMRENLGGVNDALMLAQKINRNMRQNLFGSFLYNSIAILVAAGVLYPLGILLNPMIASLVMSMSSLTVIINALRLRMA